MYSVEDREFVASEFSNEIYSIKNLSAWTIGSQYSLVWS